jgi:hypothetical protein
MYTLTSGNSTFSKEKFHFFLPRQHLKLGEAQENQQNHEPNPEIRSRPQKFLCIARTDIVEYVIHNNSNGYTVIHPIISILIFLSQERAAKKL